MRRRGAFLFIGLLLLTALNACAKELVSESEINDLRNAYYTQFAELKAVKQIMDDKGYADDPLHDAAYSGAVKDLNDMFMKLPTWTDKVTREELDKYYEHLDKVIQAIDNMKVEAENAPTP